MFFVEQYRLAVSTCIYIGFLAGYKIWMRVLHVMQSLLTICISLLFFAESIGDCFTVTNIFFVFVYSVF